MIRTARRALPGVALAAVLLVGASGPAGGHDVPADATVHVLVRPDGETVRVLVRAPLAAMRDIRFPLRGPGYLDFERLGTELRHAARTWIVDYLRLFRQGEPLDRGRIVAVRASRLSDGPFVTWEDALAHVTGPSPAPGRDLHLEGASLDVLVAYPVPAGASRVSLESGLTHLAVETRTVLRYFGPDGAERVLRFTGNPGPVRLDPTWYETGLRFLKAGLGGVLGGVEHLLFLLALVVPFRRARELAPTAVAFVVGSGITLAGTPLGLAPDGLWFPPLVATVVALSVLYAALENILGARPKRRWPAAFGFGLAHGFALAFVLTEELPFAAGHAATAVAAFTGGAELAAAVALVSAAALLGLLFRTGLPERTGNVVLSALVAHEGWHWTVDRGGELAAYRLPSLSLDPASLAGAMRWAMAALALAGVAWLLGALFRRWGLPDPAEDGPAVAERRGVEGD